MYPARIIPLLILSLLLPLQSLRATVAKPPQNPEATVYVRVTETTGNPKYKLQHGVSNAHVRLVAGADTVAAISSRSGECVFKKYKPGETFIVASRIGYKTYRDKLQIVPGANVIYIEMKPQDEKLEAAVALMEGDKAIEILQRLPGVTVSGNTISVNGESVARTYVNGVMIYGNDPSSAFYSSDASQVKEVKIYEEQSQVDKRKGLKNSRKQTVMNVTTKEKIVSAVDIVAAGAYGMDGAKDSEGKIQNRYQGAALANFYSEKFLAYAKFLTGNVALEPAFMESAPIRVVVAPLNWRPLNSYSENMTVSAGIHKFWGERVYGNNLKFDYTYNKSYDKSFRRSLTEYFQTEDNPASTYSDTTLSSSAGASHSFSLDVRLPNTPIKTINFENDFTIKDSRLHSSMTSSKYEDEAMKYRNVSDTDFSGENFTYSGKIELPCRW